MAGLLTRLKAALSPMADARPGNSAVLKQSADIPWLAQSRSQNPNLDTGTEGFGTWLELKNALIDAKASSCLDLRAQVLMTLPYQIVPRPETPPEAVDLVRRAFSRLELAEPLEQMARASYFGITPMEVTWDLVGGELLPCKIEAFDPWFLSFNAQREPLVLGKVMETGKLILHRHGAEWRNPWGLGRGRSVPRWVRVKVAVAYATYRDYPAFSHDRIHFTYPADASEPEQAKFIAIAQQMMSAPGIATPEGMVANRVQLDSKFEMGVKLIDAANAEIATAILGTTLTSGEGRGAGIGSGAPSKTHQDTEDGQKVSDAIRAQFTLNRTLIPWIVSLNLGPDVVPPQLIFDHEIQAGLKDRMDVALGFGGEGLKLSRNWVRKTFGIPEPIDADDTLDLVAMQAPEPPAPGKIRLSDEAGGATLADGGDPDPYEIFDLWAKGYRQRAAATAQHAARALRQAQTFDQALELSAASAKDFPTSAAEWLSASLRAARDLAAYQVMQDHVPTRLADSWLDYSGTPELAARWLASKVAIAASAVKGLSDEDLRARAFWVAGVDQVGVLEQLQAALVKALRSGQTYDAFRKEWLPKLEGSGVKGGQLETAFRTNIDGAYGAARFASLIASPAVENLTYVTAGDEKVRPEHRILDGVTRPKGDPFWESHTPPLGFNCRCTLRAADAGAPVTPANDPKIDTPPSTGFGTGGSSFSRYLDGLAEAPSSGLTPLSPGEDGFHWVDTQVGLRDLKATGPAPEGQAEGGLVLDATGRAIAYLGEEATVAGALEDPAEIWLTPTGAADGRTGLQLTYLQPLPDGQVLAVMVQDGVVSSRDGAQIVSDPLAYRRGVRLK